MVSLDRRFLHPFETHEEENVGTTTIEERLERREKLRDLRLEYKKAAAELEMDYIAAVREIVPPKHSRGAKPKVTV